MDAARRQLVRRRAGNRCEYCSIDPDTGAAVRLFNHRSDDWSEHFLFEAGEVLGRTPTGRATVRLLNINAPRRVQLRQEWLGAEDAWEEPDPVGD